MEEGKDKKPLRSKYTKEEKIIYDIVLEAQEKAIEECRPGNPFYITNTIATTVISQRLQELEIIKSPFEIRRYFMHGTSHYLGLDVHDPGTMGNFQPNTVITVEPGIYKNNTYGIRIEDTVYIDKNNIVIIPTQTPKNIIEFKKLKFFFQGKQRDSQ